MADKHATTISDILKQKYGKYIADGFLKYCSDHQFDDEAIILDLEDGEEAILIEETLKLMDDNKPTPNELHILLTSIIEGTYFEKKPKYVIENNDTLIPLHEYDTTVTKKDLTYIKDLVDEQCHQILNKKQDDKNLLIVLFLGRKHSLPFLTYLTDSYHRFIVQQTEKKFFNTSHWIEYCKKNTKSDIYQISQKPKGESILRIYTSAINSYCTRLVHTPMLQTKYKINDNIDDIAYYILYSYDFISNYLAQQQNINNSKRLPAQIDLWIIPEAVSSFTVQSNDNDYSDSDSDDDDTNEHKDDENMEFDIDIDERLKYIDKKLIIENIKARSLFARDIKTGFEQLITDRNQRFCMIINRQKSKQCESNINTKGNKKPKKILKIFNKKNKDINESKIDENINQGDRLYMYYLNENLNASSFLKSDKLLYPSLITNTLCMLPDLKYIGKPLSELENIYQWKHIGGLDDNGYQFTLSFHIYSRSDIRVYLSCNTYMIRFIPSDVLTILPKFFTNPNYKYNGRDIVKLVRRVVQNESVNDKRFAQFYESLTGDSLYNKM